MIALGEKSGSLIYLRGGMFVTNGTSVQYVSVSPIKHKSQWILSELPEEQCQENQVRTLLAVTLSHIVLEKTPNRTEIERESLL